MFGLLLIFWLCCSNSFSATIVQRDSLRTDTTRKTTKLRKRIIERKYYGPRKRYQAPGFRVQVYTGTNNRQSRTIAQQRGMFIQQKFPELSVYVHFVSPAWVCRVGDFVNQQDAKRYARIIRAKKLSNEARPVNCTILKAD